jgi:CRISPR-associated protein Cas6
LHARLVVTGAGDEAQFVVDIEREIEALGLECDLIVGRRGELVLGATVHAGFSLMLHGLSAAESLSAQSRGLGSHRKFGCGVFVPHRSVAPVAV